MHRDYNPVGVTVVYGGQAGSEGKGAIVGYLARRYKWGAAASTFMPNAGHTFVEGDEEVVVTQLPVGLVGPDVKRLIIGAGSAIDVAKLMEEINTFDRTYDVASRLRIDPRAVIVTEDHKAWERANLVRISSTGKGCGAALAGKVARAPSVKLAQDVPELADFIRGPTSSMLNDAVDTGFGVLAEQSQGFDLGINHGYEYPYCTSRNTGPDQICADLGVSSSLVTNRLAVIRTRPIRVGNAPGGYSGNYGSDELDWESVSGQAGRAVTEQTTVTKRTRRIFDFDYDRIAFMSRVTRPTQVALTFADYVDPGVFRTTQQDFEDLHYSLIKLSERLHGFIYRAENALGRATGRTKITLMKTGPDNSHIIDLGYRGWR